MMLIKVPGKSVRFIEISLFKGPFIFYEVVGLVGFGGGGSRQKKKRLKRGGHPKKNGVKANYFSSCRVDMMCYY